MHVAGTNGKGSTCAFLRAMAEAAGLRVHVFTSPHLVRFNERIRLAGQLIEDAHLVDVLTRTLAAVNGRPITQFEATTAAALLAFSETPADLMILEVGLGGQFDATNVIDAPAISVIAPVDRDHAQFLGTDLAGIAGEKAGIIKPGRPVVSARQHAVCAAVIEEKAQACNAPLFVVSPDDIAAMDTPHALPGAHQRANAALAAKTMRHLPGFAISEAAIAEGTRSATWPARLQRLGPGPLTALCPGAEVWLDGGHNPHAAKAIADHFTALGGNRVLVCAMMASKDHAGFFKALGETFQAVHTIDNPGGQAAVTAQDLADFARQFTPKVRAHTSLNAALKAAMADAPDRILIGGSLYLAGEVLTANNETLR
ncbi:MAG: folylpolyglutamate synthase/dihydrofolate synthase family protein [Pseudomonadota bacterium]